jgi:hypothetical protein
MRLVKKMVLLVFTLSLFAVLFQNCANFGENFGAFMGGANGAMEKQNRNDAIREANRKKSKCTTEEVLGKLETVCEDTTY